MKITHLFGAALLASAAASPATAWAQAPGQPPMAAAGKSGAPDAAQLKQAVEQRIGALQTKLAITPAQTHDWNGFADAMRDNATSTDQLFRQRADNAASMSAVDNMKSYAAIARSYADNTEKLSTAFATVYAKLSPNQQKTADELFRQPPPPTSRTRR
jgi:periplasmic protein CpxP/Spy